MESAEQVVVHGLSWFWISIALLIPPAVALLVAYPIWNKGAPIFGNIFGTIILFGAAIGFMMREHVELDAIVMDCLGRNITCWPQPSAFARYAVYAFISLVQVIALFLASLKVETRVRRRGYAPEWR
jgi:hypothetical protein